MVPFGCSFQTVFLPLLLVLHLLGSSMHVEILRLGQLFFYSNSIITLRGREFNASHFILDVLECHSLDILTLLLLLVQVSYCCMSDCLLINLVGGAGGVTHLHCYFTTFLGVGHHTRILDSRYDVIFFLLFFLNSIEFEIACTDRVFSLAFS